jgi:hypothetical protein
MKYCSGLLRGCVLVGAREHYSIQGYRAFEGLFWPLIGNASSKASTQREEPFLDGGEVLCHS